MEKMCAIISVLSLGIEPGESYALVEVTVRRYGRVCWYRRYASDGTYKMLKKLFLKCSPYPQSSRWHKSDVYIWGA